jgi:hypothetical protein
VDRNKQYRPHNIYKCELFANSNENGDGARQGGLYLKRRQHVRLSQETEKQNVWQTIFSPRPEKGG